MSLRPIKTKRSSKRGYYRSFHSKQVWKPWQGWNTKTVKRFDPSKHKRVILGLFILSLAVFVYGWGQNPSNPLFHSQSSPCALHLIPGAPCNDPSQTLWEGSDISNLADWNTHNGNAGSPIQYKTGSTCSSVWTLPNTAGCIDMNYSGNSTNVAETKSPIGDLSSASKSLLAFHITWGIRYNAPPYGPSFDLRQATEWGYFLTTNATGYDQAYYHEVANFDPNILLEVYFACDSGCSTANPTIGEYVAFRRTVGAPTNNTIYSENNGCDQTGSYYVCDKQLAANGLFAFDSAVYLNYTGVVGPSVCTVTGNPGVIGPAPGCSWAMNEPLGGNAQSQYWANSQTLPWFQLQTNQLYFGFFVGPTLGSDPAFSFNYDAASGPAYQPAMDIFTFTPAVAGPPIDTGGFFGPVIKALIGIGTFILNGILAFIGFITPALQAALGVLEQFMAQALNFIGGLLGYPTLGTDLINFINNLVTFFTNNTYGLPAAFSNFPTLFTDFINWLQTVFPVLTPMFSIATSILTVAVKTITTGIFIIQIGLELIFFGYGTLLMFTFIVFVADDGIGGVLNFLGMAQAVAFKVINVVAMLVNFGLDVLTNVIGLIPKPLVQMTAAKFPRLPTLETSASIVFPRFDFADLRSGNLLSGFLIMVGFYIDAWYESQNPALPGSIGQLIPSLATNMQKLSNLVPLLQIFVLVSGGIALMWMVMRPLALLGADLGIFESVGVGVGGAPVTGPGGVKFSRGKAHLRRGLSEIRSPTVEKKEPAGGEVTGKAAKELVLE